MKKVFFSLIAIMMFATVGLKAQKYAYCQKDKIVQIMPEYEKAKAKLEGEVKDIQKQAEDMQVEFNNKYKAYTDNMALKDGDPKKWSPAIVQVKEQELQQLQQRIQDFQSTAQQTIQKAQVDLLKPIEQKVDSAINVVMAEKGYIFTITDLTAIQVNKKKVDDIAPLVKQKLGLQ
jgi:outer membrane protein